MAAGSGAHTPAGTADSRPGRPFTPKQLLRLDEALTLSSRETGVQFSVYVGELGPTPRPFVQQLHSELGAMAADSVLVAVSPGECRLEIVTGEHAATRLPDRSCALVALSMTAAFGGGDLVGGIVTGLRMLADQAGRPS